MRQYYLGLDVGTTAVKGMLIDGERRVLASESREHRQYFPQPGWVEQDPLELLNSCVEIIADLMRRGDFRPGQIRAIGLDHQGETCLIWERKTGQPVYPAITWQDRRMAARSDAYAREHGEDIRRITGLRPDSYYSAWKIRWILDHIPDGQRRAESGDLLAGTLNTWLIWKLTGGTAFVTDEGSAGCTMLADPRVMGWEPWLLREMQIPEGLLPQIRPADDLLGWTDEGICPAGRVAVRASLTDCAAGIIAAGLPSRGGFITTYGTGNFMHLTTGECYVPPQEGLTASCCYATSRGRVCQLNGINYTAGSALQWLRNGLGLFADVSELEPLARSVPDCGGVSFVPALNGLATPFWDQSARGGFLGMTAGTTRAHLVRAVLESSALQVANCCAIMRRVSRVEPAQMIAMGGMTQNGFLMQLQADLLGIPVCLPRETEPAYGAACFALAADRGTDPAEAGRDNVLRYVYTPQMSRTEREEKIGYWNYAVQRCLNWYPAETTE